MAVTLLSTRADRTNRALLAFSGDLDADTFEVGTGVLIAADGGAVPSLVGWYEVPLHPEQAWAVFDSAFRRVVLSLAYAGLLDNTGDPVAGTAVFTGIEPSNVLRYAYDRRLKVDLATSATVGGDLALLLGDSFVREQVNRLLSWQQGELMADPEFGTVLQPQRLLSTRSLSEYRRLSERKARLLPGVRAASTSLVLDASHEVLRVRMQVHTDQTEMEVSVQRLLGR